MSEQENETIFNTFEILHAPKSDKTDDSEDIPEVSPLEEERKFIEDQFRDVWGWVDLAMGLTDILKEPFFKIMALSVVEVLTIATYSRDKINIVKMKHGNGNTGTK